MPLSGKFIYLHPQKYERGNCPQRERGKKEKSGEFFKSFNLEMIIIAICLSIIGLTAHEKYFKVFLPHKGVIYSLYKYLNELTFFVCVCLASELSAMRKNLPLKQQAVFFFLQKNSIFTQFTALFTLSPHVSEKMCVKKKENENFLLFFIVHSRQLMLSLSIAMKNGEKKSIHNRTCMRFKKKYE